MFGDQRFELGNDLGVAAGGEVCVESLLESRDPRFNNNNNNNYAIAR